MCDIILYYVVLYFCVVFLLLRTVLESLAPSCFRHLFIEPRTPTAATHRLSPKTWTKGLLEGYPELIWILFWVGGICLQVALRSMRSGPSFGPERAHKHKDATKTMVSGIPRVLGIGATMQFWAAKAATPASSLMHDL